MARCRTARSTNSDRAPRRRAFYLVSGWTPIDEFAEFMSLKLGDDLEYQTVAGLVLEELKHLPVLGESFTRDGWRFEVIDLDGRRIDKIPVSLLTRARQPTSNNQDRHAASGPDTIPARRACSLARYHFNASCRGTDTVPCDAVTVLDRILPAFTRSVS